MAYKKQVFHNSLNDTKIFLKIEKKLNIDTIKTILSHTKLVQFCINYHQINF